MTPIEVEVVIPTLTTVGFGCRKCTTILEEAGIHSQFRESCWDEFPEDLKKDLDRLTQWISRISQLYKHRVRISVVDAHSLPGVWKQLRYRVSCTPAFIVNRKRVHSGWDTEKVEALIDEQIKEAATGMQVRA